MHNLLGVTDNYNPNTGITGTARICSGPMDTTHLEGSPIAVEIVAITEYGEWNIF
jgi:hypothetical protein